MGEIRGTTCFIIIFLALSVLSFSVYALNPYVVEITPEPVYLRYNQDNSTNISIMVIHDASINTVQSQISYPNLTKTNYTLNTQSDFYNASSYTIDPYNLTSYSYNIYIYCYDFTDDSECNINASNFYGSCANVTFDDDPIIGGASEDLDIGVLLCVTENSTAYDINFTRWGYDASNNISVKYCIDSMLDFYECSDYVLDNTTSDYANMPDPVIRSSATISITKVSNDY